jgi:hypothetical protein
MLQHELNPMERFNDLLSGGDDRADMQILLLYNILVALAGQETAQGEPFPTSMDVQIPLKIISVDLMKNIAALTTAEIPPQRMADCRKALRVVVWVNNNFDQQVAVTIIGNTSSDYSGAFDIHSMNVAAGAKGAYGVKWEEWMPWIAVKVTPAGNPTGGTISAVAVLMEQGSGQ